MHELAPRGSLTLGIFRSSVDEANARLLYAVLKAWQSSVRGHSDVVIGQAQHVILKLELLVDLLLAELDLLKHLLHRGAHAVTVVDLNLGRVLAHLGARVLLVSGALCRLRRRDHWKHDYGVGLIVAQFVLAHVVRGCRRRGVREVR